MHELDAEASDKLIGLVAQGAEVRGDVQDYARGVGPHHQVSAPGRPRAAHRLRPLGPAPRSAGRFGIGGAVRHVVSTAGAARLRWA